jgi:hypothetical protein
MNHPLELLVCSNFENASDKETTKDMNAELEVEH